MHKSVHEKSMTERKTGKIWEWGKKIEKSSEKSIWLFIAFWTAHFRREIYNVERREEERERKREREKIPKDFRSRRHYFWCRTFALLSLDQNFPGLVLPKFRCLHFFSVFLSAPCHESPANSVLQFENGELLRDARGIPLSHYARFSPPSLLFSLFKFENFLSKWNLGMTNKFISLDIFQ